MPGHSCQRTCPLWWAPLVLERGGDRSGLAQPRARASPVGGRGTKWAPWGTPRSSEGERGGRTRGCGRDPGGPRHRLGRPRRDPQHAAKAGDGPRTGHGRLAGGCHGSRGEQGGRARTCNCGPGGPHHRLGRPRRDPQHAAQAREEPRTGHGRLAGGRRSSSSGQGEREVPRPRPPHPPPHQPPQAVLPQALPPGAGAACPPPGARALAAGRHAAAAAKTAGRPARDSGRRGGRAGRAACQPRERGAGGRRRQGKCPGARARSRPGHARQGARAQQRGGAERRQLTARLRAGGREGTRAREGRAGARAGSPGAGGRARGGG